MRLWAAAGVLEVRLQIVQVDSSFHICTCRSRLICCSLVHRLSWLIVSSRIFVSNLQFCSSCKVYVPCNLCLYLCNCFLRSLRRKQVCVRAEYHTYSPARASQVLLVRSLCLDYHFIPSTPLAAMSLWEDTLCVHYICLSTK